MRKYNLLRPYLSCFAPLNIVKTPLVDNSVNYSRTLYLQYFCWHSYRMPALYKTHTSSKTLGVAKSYLRHS